jgi:hypothetical protein
MSLLCQRRAIHRTDSYNKVSLGLISLLADYVVDQGEQQLWHLSESSRVLFVLHSQIVIVCLVLHNRHCSMHWTLNSMNSKESTLKHILEMTNAVKKTERRERRKKKRRKVKRKARRQQDGGILVGG